MNILTHYLLGKVYYILPAEFIVTYLIFIIRYLFAGFILSYYFLADYTVITLAISVLIADFKFHANVYNIMKYSEE